MPNLAKLLRDLRLEKRLTQSDVAGRLKMSQSTYSAMERGLKPREVKAAMEAVNRMRFRSARTGGGDAKAGRLKSE